MRSPDEFARVLLDHRDGIHRVLWWLTRDAAVTDELLQETFLVASQDRASVAGTDARAARLRRTAYCLWRDRQTEAARRAKSTRASLLVRSDSVPSDDRGHASSPVQRVTQAVDGLPEEVRVVFVLFRCAGLTCAQIGETINVPPGSVEASLRRAITLLGEEARRHRERLPEG